MKQEKEKEPEDGDALSVGHELVQELQTLGLQFVGQHVDPCEITAGPGEAGDKTEPGRVFADEKNDGDDRGGRFGRECRRRASGGDDHGSLPGQLARHIGQTIDSIFGPAVNDRDVLALDEFRPLSSLGGMQRGG